LAELLLERGELDRAQRVLSKARELAPSHPAAARLQRSLREQRGLSDPEQSEDDGPLARTGSAEAGPEDLIAAAEEEERARRESPKAPHPRVRRRIIVGLLLLVSGLTLVGFWLQSASEPSRAVHTSETQKERLGTPEPATGEVLSVPPSLEPPPSPIRPEGPQPVEPPTKSTHHESSERELGTLPWKQLSRDPVALVARADQLYEAGRRSTAASLYRRALRLRPDYPPAMLGVSRSLVHAKNTRAAMSLATRVIESDVAKTPAIEARALYLVGRIHYERGERVSARRLLREATTLPDAPPEAWFYLGETLSRDNSPAARQAYEEYLRAVPSGSLAARARKAIQ
jgi:tetratricopeptide (TPR) repeat protein